MLDLRPPGFEFRILCLEGSVISPSSGGSPGPIYPVCARMWTKALISFELLGLQARTNEKKNSKQESFTQYCVDDSLLS